MSLFADKRDRAPWQVPSAGRANSSGTDVSGCPSGAAASTTVWCWAAWASRERSRDASSDTGRTGQATRAAPHCVYNDTPDATGRRVAVAAWRHGHGNHSCTQLAPATRLNSARTISTRRWFALRDPAICTVRSVKRCYPLTQHFRPQFAIFVYANGDVPRWRRSNLPVGHAFELAFAM